MLFAVGWAVVRCSREPYRQVLEEHGEGSPELLEALERVDDEVQAQEVELLARLKSFLVKERLGLDWHIGQRMYHSCGVLTFTSSSNHRGQTPGPVDLLRWLAEQGPGSYGLVYLHDDEDVGDAGRARGRDGTDCSNEFRVWRLLAGKVEELDDPFLSPIIPRLDPNHYA